MKSFNPLPVVMAALASAAAVCCVVFGISWYSAAHSATSSYARTRDSVLESAEQAVINLNTLDYRHAAAGLATWLDSSTGPLRAGFASGLPSEVAAAQAAGNTTSARVLDAAVTALDPAGGTASVMVAVDISVVPAHGQPYRELQSELGQLALTPSGWKLSALSFANSSSSPPASPSPSPTGSR